MRDVYKNVTRGLFGKHKTFFSFIIAVAIQREAKTISEDMWNVFSKGALTIGKNISKDPP